jgi:hypothetical protein
MTTPRELGEVVSPLVTANDWVSLPEIRPDDAAIMSVGVLSMRHQGLVEWAGGLPTQPEALAGAPPLFAPFVEDLETGEHAGAVSCWSLLEDWVPCACFKTRLELDISLTILAPVGWETRGCVFLFRAVNRGNETLRVRLGLRGCVGAVFQTIFTRRLIHVSNHLYYREWTRSLMLEARGDDSVGALALTADDEFDWWSEPEPQTSDSVISKENDGASSIRFEAGAFLSVAPGQTVSTPFYIAAGPDPDAAGVTAVHMRRLGAAEMLQETLRWLAERGFGPGHTRASRNFFFSRFFAHGRAIDTEDLVMLTSRSPRYYVSAAFWPRDTFLWAYPVMVDRDPAFAREILVTAFRRHARNAGIHAHYIGGTLLYPGFELDQLASYVIALGRYVNTTGDLSVVAEEPISRGVAAVMQTLPQWRHPTIALYRTFLDPSDDPVRYPYLTYDNVLVWRALSDLAQVALKSGRPDDAQRYLSQAEEVAQAVLTHCIVEGSKGPMFAWSVDLEGNHEIYDDPPGSLVLLAYYGFVSPADRVFANTLAWIMSSDNPYRSASGRFTGVGCAHSPRPWPMHACNTLLAGVKDDACRDLIENAPLDGGLACETIYESTGKVATGAAFATFAGFLALALSSVGRRTVG